MRTIARKQVGGAVGLAALATVSRDRTRHLIVMGCGHPTAALTSGYHLASVTAAECLIASVIVALIVHPRTCAATMRR